MKTQRKILSIFAIMLLIAGMSCSKTEIEDKNEFKMNQKNEIMAPPKNYSDSPCMCPDSVMSYRCSPSAWQSEICNGASRCDCESKNININKFLVNHPNFDKTEVVDFLQKTHVISIEFVTKNYDLLNALYKEEVISISPEKMINQMAEIR